MQRRGRPDRRDEAGRQPQHRDRAGTRLLQRRDAWRPDSLESRNHRHRYGDDGAELTAPDRKPEYDGYMRTVYSDIDQGASDAKYVHDVLKAQKIVTIHDGSPMPAARDGDGGQLQEALVGPAPSKETEKSIDEMVTETVPQRASATEKPDVHRSPLRSSPPVPCRRGKRRKYPGWKKRRRSGALGKWRPT